MFLGTIIVLDFWKQLHKSWLRYAAN